MLKVEIKLNEKKIEYDARYSISSIYQAIDKAFAKYDFRKEKLSDGTVCYYGNGNARDYGTFGRITTSLKDKEWFTPYLTKWLWYNSDDGESENDFCIEDVLYHYTRRESMA